MHPFRLGAGSTARTFAPAFYQTEPVGSTGISTHAPGEAQVYYMPTDDTGYSNVETFEASQDYRRLLEQAASHLTKILQFAVNRGMPTTDWEFVQQSFAQFINRLGNGFYADHRADLYATCNPALQAFREALGDEALPLEKRLPAVRDLASGLLVCSGGTITNLTDAARNLRLSVGGLAGQIWRVKDQIIQQECLAFSQERHGNAQNYEGDEIHFVNAYKEALADLGIDIPPDRFADRRRLGISDADLENCRIRIEQALTPVRLASVLAEEFISQLRDGLVSRFGTGDTIALDTPDANEALDTVRQALQQKFGDVDLQSALLPLEDGNYRLVRNRTALATLSLLAKMKDLRLLSENCRPDDLVNWSRKSQEPRWKDGKMAMTIRDVPLALRRQEDLLWVDEDSEATFLSVSHLDEVSPSKVFGSVAGSNLDPERGMQMCKSVLREAIANTEPQDIRAVPDSWLGHARLVELLARCSAEMPIEPAVARKWVAVSANDRDAQGRTPIMLAVEHEQAAVLDALLEDSELVIEQLTAHNQDGEPVLAQAMENGKEAGVARLIQSIFALPANHWPGLLGAITSEGMPGLALAFAAGRQQTVNTFVRAILESDLDHDQQENLLSAKDIDNHIPGLIYAFSNKHAATIAGFARLVLASKLDHVRQVRLLKAFKDDIPRLLAAIANNDHETVGRFADEVLDSQLSEEDKEDLLTAKDGTDTPVSGWHWASNNNTAEAIGTLVRKIAASNLQPDRKLRMLTSPNRGGESLLASVIRRGKTVVVESVAKEILASPLDEDVKVSILLAMDHSGNHVIGLAFRQRHAETVKVFAEAVLSSNISDMNKLTLLQAMHLGSNGLALAFKNNDAATIDSFVKTVVASGFGLKVAVLTPRIGARITMPDAFVDTHVDSLMALTQAIINSDLPDEDKIAVLSAKNADELCPGFFGAFMHGRVETVKGFTHAVLSSNLVPETKLRLLSARDEEGEPAITVGFRNGNTVAVREFVAAVLASSLDEPQKAELLVGEDSEGWGALRTAFAERNTETISSFVADVLVSNLSSEAKFRVLSAVNPENSYVLDEFLGPDSDFEQLKAVDDMAKAIRESSLDPEHKEDMLTSMEDFREVVMASEVLSQEQKDQLISQSPWGTLKRKRNDEGDSDAEDADDGGAPDSRRSRQEA
jgi:hypothetical protein